MAIYRGAGGAGDAVADSSTEASLIRALAVEVQADADAAEAARAAAVVAKTAAETAETNAETAETNAETAETNAEAAEAAAVVAKDAAEAVLLDTGFIAVAADLQGADNIGTVAASITDVNDVADNIADVTAVAANETNIDAVAANNTNITTVAGISGNVTTVAGISANVTSVATNAANINTVATDITNVNAVGTNIANVNSVAGNATNINAVNANKTNIDAVAGNNTNITAVAGNATNINAVNANATNINTVATNNANVTTVAGISSNVTTVAGISANVTTVAGISANVTSVAGNASNINQVASDTVAINSASANATSAAASALSASNSATSASASAAAASAVALGNEPVRHSVRPSLLLDFANTKTLDPRITFTRASTGTYYDGKTVAKAEENLFTYSQEFDNASWAKSAATTTANSTTAPDGTTTAETVIATAVSGYHGVTRTMSLTASLPHTISVFAKASGYTNLSIAEGSSGVFAARFDLSAVSVISTLAGTTATITDVGNGWYRCTATFTSGSGNFTPSIIGYPAGATLNAFGAQYTGDGTFGVFLWGAQLEQRSSVTAYTATTTAPITNYIPALQTAASGVARFEHNPVTGESLGLEIEEQRTNLLTYSEDLSNAIWTKTATAVYANTVIAPDGALTGDTLSVSTVASAQGVGIAFTADGTSTYTGSIYVRKVGNVELLFVYRANISTGNVYSQLNFNTSTGFVGFSGSSATTSSYSVTDVGGWWRISITAGGIPAGTMRLNVRVVSQPVGTNLFLWGAQLEAGSFATSYIPTVASQVTRSSDSASMTGTNFSSWYRADEGTLYAEAIVSRTSWCSFISNSSASNYIAQRYSAIGTGVAGDIVANSVTQASIGTATASGKNSLTYKVNDFAVSVNGAAASTDVLGSVPVVDRITFGSDNSGNSVINGTIKKFAYYAKKLTNAELVGLTTI